MVVRNGKGKRVGIQGCWPVDGLELLSGVGWMRMEESEGGSEVLVWRRSTP